MSNVYISDALVGTVMLDSNSIVEMDGLTETPQQYSTETASQVYGAVTVLYGLLTLIGLWKISTGRTVNRSR